MKLFSQLILESQASDAAHKIGLKSAGWGKWKDSSGKVTHQTKDGKLVKIGDKKQKSKEKTQQQNQKTELSNFYNAAKNWNHLSPDKQEKIVNFVSKNNEWFRALDPNEGPINNSKNLNTFKVLLNQGYEIGKFIGSGTAGSAFEMKNGNVLKITKDKSEAKAMNMVKKYPHPNIVKVGRVFKIKGNDQYFIDQEKLYQLPNKFTTNKFNILKAFYEIAKDKLEKDGVESTYNETIKQIDNRDSQWIKSNEEAQKFIFDVLKATKHLQKLHINFEDFHMGNVLRDEEGNYKLIDLGMSTGPGLKKSKIKRISI